MSILIDQLDFIKAKELTNKSPSEIEYKEAITKLLREVRKKN